MNDRSLRPMYINDLKTYYRFIEKDFSRGEYPPYAILQRQISDGRQQGFILHNWGQDLAYAICSAGHDYVLISLMAVLPQWRGQGIGSDLLKRIKDQHSDRSGLIAELERPELALQAEEQQTRQSRLGFYYKAGFQLIAGIDYTIWGVPLHLMACPLGVNMNVISAHIESIMYEIYLNLSGPQYIHNMVINRVDHDPAGTETVRPETYKNMGERS